MSCYFHPEEASVASCIDCGKGLCRACAAKYEIAVCDACNSKRNRHDKDIIGAIFFKRILPSIALFGFAFWWASVKLEKEISFNLLFGYLAMSIPWGWSLVKRWMGGVRFNLLHGGIGAIILFVFYWAFRIGFSVAFGGIFFPIEVIRLIIAHRRAKGIDSLIAGNNSEATNNNDNTGSSSSSPNNTEDSVSTTPSIKPKTGKKLLVVLVILGVLAGGLYMARSYIAPLISSLTTKAIPPSEDDTSENATLEDTSTIIRDVNFRTKPSADSTIIRTLRKDDTVTLTGEVSGGWTQIRHNGDTGWVSSEYVK